MSNLAAAIHGEGIKKMAFDQRQALEVQLKELKEQLGRAEGADGTAPKPELLQGAGELRRRIKGLEELLNKDDDLIPKGAEKDRVVARLKEIETIIKKELPSERTQRMTVRSNGDRDFNRAVEQTVHHQKKYGKLIEEWQELRRRLEPENPEAADVELLWK